MLVAQDLAAFGRDQGVGERSIVPLVDAVAARVARVRLLYLYPSDLTDGLVDAICRTGVPYFDLSLQHVSRPLLRRMRRWGDGDRFLARIDDIRAREPEAAFRSNFIVGYPGETEADHDALLRFVEAADLDWCGFFSFSREEGTYAAGLDGVVPDAPRRPSAWPSSGSSRTGSPRGNVTFRWANGSKASWTSPVPPARRGKPPRSTG